MPWRYATPAHIAERLLLAPPQPADEAGDFPPVLSLSFARVLDCAVYGHVCRTVLAVGRRPPNSEGGCTWAIVVDCRPILQGWHYVATAGVVDFDRLEVELGELAPPFWELFIVNRPAGAGHHSVCDGQVFVAEFRARRQEFSISLTRCQPHKTPLLGRLAAQLARMLLSTPTALPPDLASYQRPQVMIALSKPVLPPAHL